MDCTNLNSIGVISIIIVILFLVIYRPFSVVCAGIVVSLLLLPIIMKKVPPQPPPPTSCDMAPFSLQQNNEKGINTPMLQQNKSRTGDVQHESLFENNTNKKVDMVEKSNVDQHMSDLNKLALDQMYGRHGSNVDDKMSEHRQRIGDRDHKATVAQIKGRRNNSMEPYYRQELEQYGSKKWWNPDTVLMRKATKKQKKTIMIGPDAYMPN
jgi:hypothetical protein